MTDATSFQVQVGLVFEPGSAPSEMEFKLLKTAADMAAVAFQIAEM